jgi:hypothetical protein
MNAIKTGIVPWMITFFILFFSGTIYADTELRCEGERVRVGQTIEQVKDTFGEPLEIEQAEPQDQDEFEDQDEPTANITKLIYQCGLRTFSLVFKNEKLITIRHITRNNNETENNAE